MGKHKQTRNNIEMCGGNQIQIQIRNDRILTWDSCFFLIRSEILTKIHILHHEILHI